MGALAPRQWYSLSYYLCADRFMNIRNCNNIRGSVQDTTFIGMSIESNRIATMHNIREVMTVKQGMPSPIALRSNCDIRRIG
jgi:hypothetical protein